MMKQFDYGTAFSRNVGWVSDSEQELLRTKTISIAGMGGVGGSHLLTLTRLGIGGFRLSDLDVYELANFNRQAGATLSTIGQTKVDTMASKALDINPELRLEIFPEGLTADNSEEFINGSDLYVDGLDFFAVAARRRVFALCSELGVPAITAAPLGMGAALLNFLPGKMSFEDYFQLDGESENEQFLRFFVGLAPAGLQQRYLVDPSKIDLPGHKGPSTSIGCELCAGVAATQALKILLGRGKVFAAPHGLQFDAYTNKVAHTWRPGGNSHPLHKLALRIGRRRILEQPPAPKIEEEAAIYSTHVEKIIDLARWAPSGDNTQPWRFEILGDDHFVVHGTDTRDWCVYDLDGRASVIAIGALLENISIAASGEGLKANFTLDEEMPEHKPTIDVRLAGSPEDSGKSVAQNHLLPFIKLRVTQRRPFSTRPLRKTDRELLDQAVGENYHVFWVDDQEGRRKLARLLFRNAHIRLTIPEAYQVHKRIIEWDSRFSIDRIPDQAVGLDPVNLKSMRWAMQSWKRIVFLNRFLAGTVIPRIILDLIPGLKCAAHFLIVADKEPESIQDYLDGGRALQRFWLTTTSLGLQFQPEMTPLIFSRFASEKRRFTDDPKALRNAEKLRRQLASVVGEKNLNAAVFMGRIGYGAYPDSRSKRLPMDKIILE